MKPIKLEIEGLNSFETKQVLDFESLGNGVFGIFGKTGSGKSTILDAITLALYGKVERTKQNVDFVNTKSSKATVSLEFEIFSAGKTRRLLVTRVFSRKKNGTEVDSSASLYEIDGDNKNLIEEGSSKVGDKIFGILGLGVNEFAKCIALPQGEFSAFLQAKPAERTEIMSNIFDLSKYGEKLAFAVKEKISMWDKEVSVLSASRDMVAYATDDVLSATKSGLEETRKQYEETSNLLGEKSRKLAKIKTDALKKEELEKIIESLNKLEKQEDEISKLSVQIEKGQSANEVRADYEKLNKATADEKELSEKIAELNEVKLKKQSEVQSAEIEFVDFKNVYDEKIVELNAKIARLLELENDEVEVKKAEVEKQETVEKIKEKQIELSAEQENNAYFVSVLTDIQGKITAIDEFIEKNKPDVDLSYALEQTKGVESELILIDDYYKRLENLIDQTEIELKRNQEDYADCIKREKDLQAKREKIVNSIEVAFEDVDNTDFKKIRSLDNELDGMREVKALNQKIDEQILKLVENNDAKRAIIVSIENEIYVEEKKLNDFETSILAKEKDLLAFREERDGLFGENVISMISNHLKIGDNCPVCDNRVVQNLSCEANDMSGIESQIAHANAELSNLRYERDKMFASVISLKTRVQFERNVIRENEHEIEMLTESKSALYQKFVEAGDDEAGNFERLFELLQKTSDSLEELISLQEVIRGAELQVVIEKTTAGTKVSVYKEYLESLIDMLYDLQRKKAEREFVIFNVNEKFENLKEYKKQIAEGKNIELEIENKKEEKSKLREEQLRVTSEKSGSDMKLAEIRTTIQVLEEKLSNLEKQISTNNAKIQASGVPEGASVDSEKHETDKALAKLKFDYDGKQTHYESSKESLNRTENEYNVNSSILTSKRNEIHELQNLISESLTKNNFASTAELESCFVEPGELKIKQAKVNEFFDTKRLLTSQKENLEKEELLVVSKEEIDALETEVLSLEEEVKKLSEGVGKAGADLDRIVEANETLHKLSDSLEVAKKNYDTAKELGSVLRGKALAEYVCEEYLQEITASANQKLSVLMDGRYTLKFENKEFFVEDNFNDGKVRPASTLSGGETFVVSLSLALSISDAISTLSSRNMEFFFLDEGFGTLDAELCSVVVSSLYKLESQNLKIGLISHVSDLAESIKNKVLVTKGANGTKLEIVHSL